MEALDILEKEKEISKETLFEAIENIHDKFGLNVIVAINKYASDTEKEINFLREKLEEKGIGLSLVEGYTLGGEGARDIATKLVSLVEEKENFKFIYDEKESVKDKIFKVAKEIYRASGVEYSKEAIEQIKQIEKLGFGNVPVCIAKTQYSLSDDPKNLRCDKIKMDKR